MRSIKGKSVLVTGGAGFIGSHLVDALLAQGASKVVAVDNLFLGRKENLAEARGQGKRFVFVAEDAKKLPAMKKLVKEHKVEIVFGLATIPLPASLVRPRWSSREIFELALTLCELARAGEFASLVYVSSSEAYGSAIGHIMDENHPLAVETPYAAAKAAGDLLVRSYQRTFAIDATVLRPFNNYGPRQNDRSYAGVIPITIRRILAGKPPVLFGDGKQTRDFIFVKDTAEAMVRGYTQPGARGQLINVASGKEVEIGKLVRSISKLMGYDGPIEHQPERVADVKRHRGDSTLAKKLLGFRPATGIAEGLEETVRWYRES